MKRGGKAQVSVEFITVFGFVLLMTVPLVTIFFDQSEAVKDRIAENQLRNIAIKIADKAETMYYLGEPSRTTLKAYFPERIENVNITQRTIIFEYRRAGNALSPISYTSRVNISGTISTEPGIHYLEIRSLGDEISITG